MCQIREVSRCKSLSNLLSPSSSSTFKIFLPGSRIIAHLANEFHRGDSSAKLSIGAACIGGGQGISVLLEKA